MDTEGTNFPSSQGNSFIFVRIDAFSGFVVTNPAPQISFIHAIQTLPHHWITKFGPPQYHVTDRGTEYIIQDMTHLCSLFNINHTISLSQLTLSPYQICFSCSSSFPLTFSPKLIRDSSKSGIATYYN